VAGKGKGFDGDRGGLTFLTLKLFRNLSYKPTFLLFENVPAITNKHFIGGFNLMLNELESLGYTNHIMRLNAKHYGVPQNRDRVYVLSVRNDYPLEFQTPKTKSMPPLKDYIEKQNDEFNLSENQKKILEKTKINIDINKGVFVATAPNSREYKGFKDVSPTLCARDYKDPKWVSLPNDSLTIIDDTQGFDGVRIYGNYSPTLRSQRQGLKVQDRLHIRKLTPLEYFRLMGFSDTDYEKAKAHASNSTLYKQAGNSIVVQVLESIFDNIFVTKLSTDKIPLFPKELKKDIKKSQHKTFVLKTRDWSQEEEDWAWDLYKEGYNYNQIAYSLDRESSSSVPIKMKRLKKKYGEYNDPHKEDKYEKNKHFIALFDNKNLTVLDCFCGDTKFYNNLCKTVHNNDINKSIVCDTNLDANDLLLNLIKENKTFDVVDLDPYGASIIYLDNALKVATQGLVMTLGEYGHKRWKRLDFISKHYDINVIEDLTIDNLIDNIIKKAKDKNITLTPVLVGKYNHIGRVWFTIRKGENNESN
jgi:DNA (cytosine-5)-methyltransferase 1